MVNCCFFIDKNVKEFKLKNSFDEILSFDLKPLKMNTYALDMSQICKGLSKDSYIKTHLMGKILRG